MSQLVTKTKFKARALEFFRRVETTGEEIIITDRGKPTLRLVRFETNRKNLLEDLRGSVLKYDDPCEPIDSESWSALH